MILFLSMLLNERDMEVGEPAPRLVIFLINALPQPLKCSYITVISMDRKESVNFA
jgi:hypothetical protein